jgi:hypothetical protein
MAVLAGSSWSFDIASQRLWELCGVRISDETIRHLTHAVGEQAGVWLQTSETAVENIRKARGNVEFYTDGTSVNTRQGWREMRLSVWAKRLSGDPAEPSQWDSRSLPKPTARWVCAGMHTSEELGPQWAEMSRRIGLPDGFGVSVLADGARWIWRQVAGHLSRSECVVDVFHVSEHLHACGRTLYGDQTPEAREWAERQLETALASGPIALLRELDHTLTGTAEVTKRQAVEGLIAYLKPNIDGLWYRDRLRRGLPIGSGMVEGACKTVVGRRLKCNGARWQVPNAERMAALCCLLYSEQWSAYWSTRAA